MKFATSQQIANYYTQYQNIEVVFTKEVMQTIHFNPSQVFVRAAGGQWPCVVNSASMQGAKIVCSRTSGLFEKLMAGLKTLNLRFAFLTSESGRDGIAFFVSAKVIGLAPYSGAKDLVVVSLEYTQRAPDGLIETLGTLIEANINSKRRAHERIAMTPDNVRRLNLIQKETIVFIQQIPRRCILLDLSFMGAKIILIGLASFLKDQECVLKLEFQDPEEVFGLRGKSIRTEPVQGRKDLLALAVGFYPDNIPLKYKMRISSFFAQGHGKPGESGFDDDYFGYDLM